MEGSVRYNGVGEVPPAVDYEQFLPDLDPTTRDEASDEVSEESGESTVDQVIEAILESTELATLLEDAAVTGQLDVEAVAKVLSRFDIEPDEADKIYQALEDRGIEVKSPEVETVDGENPILAKKNLVTL